MQQTINKKIFKKRVARNWEIYIFLLKIIKKSYFFALMITGILTEYNNSGFFEFIGINDKGGICFCSAKYYRFQIDFFCLKK
uniref:Uncharacterized protein n=1 Tax=Panagrolaimus sp. ES5 TaxID=591445 RepID=A0AC34F7T8_9BILA